MKKLLLVDDNKQYAEDFTTYFARNFDIIVCHSEVGFKKVFSPYLYDLVLLDIRLKEEKEGFSVLKNIKAENPYLPVIMITEYDETDFYTEAISLQADAYLNKTNFSFPAIKKVIETILDKSRLEKKISNLEKRLETVDVHNIIGKSEKICEVHDKIRMAANDGMMTTLVRGETGVGKELVARNIHSIGQRRNGPFITVMIAGMPEEVLYSELFGHEKGSFTGASEKRRGFIEEAHQGILFLDEIGDLDIEDQIKLLRVIEGNAFTRLGGNREIKVDVQFIAATNKDLENLIKQNKFRQDLYYRLKVFEIVIPPLRDRKEDIPLLVDYYLDLMFKSGRTTARKTAPGILNIFKNYDWPGNVRELKNIVETLGTYARHEYKESIDDEFRTVLSGIMCGELQFEKMMTGGNTDIKKQLAISELQCVSAGMKKFGKKKKDLYMQLKYPNRFTFLRRIKRIFEIYPDFKDEFRDVYELFYN